MPFMSRTKGDWAWTGSNQQVFIPDVKIPADGKEDGRYGVPLRGYGHTVGVWDSKTDKFVGYMVVEELGMKNVKEWMEHANLEPIRKFMEKSTLENGRSSSSKVECHECGNLVKVRDGLLARHDRYGETECKASNTVPVLEDDES